MRSCIWPHWPRAFGLRSAVTSAPVSVRSFSPVSASVSQLGLEPPAGLAPLLVEPHELRVDAAELLLERRDELLDGLLALVEVALGLGLGGPELGARQLGELGHARLERLGAQRLERRRQALLGVGDGGEPLLGQRALVLEVRRAPTSSRSSSADPGRLARRASAAAGRSTAATTAAPASKPMRSQRAFIARRAWRAPRTEWPAACKNSPVPERPVRRRAIVRGNVQGVFFRDSTREQAEQQGVGGWVSNRSDGAVEAVLEGPPDAVERVLRFSTTGRPAPTWRTSRSPTRNRRG